MAYTDNEKTPVIIAAYNEEVYIGASLASLDRNTVEPIVVSNGSTDRTAAIARRYTDHVLELDEAGKLPALQTGMKYLGERALRGILLLDADSRPTVPAHWDDAMTWPFIQSRPHPDQPARPVLTAGGIKFTGGGLISDTVRNVARQRDQATAERLGTIRAVFGANMGVYLREPELLDEFLALEHIWPGEDRYMAQLVQARGGLIQYVRHRTGSVKTSSRSLQSLPYRLLYGRQNAIERNREHYFARAAPGVTHSFVAGELVAKAKQEAA